MARHPKNGLFISARFCVNGHDTQMTGRTKKSACIECSKVGYRKHQYKKRYGITIEQFNEMFEKQNGLCAICGAHQSKLKQTLNVDHSHINGKVRGLLCPSCNKNLGILENKDFCLKASLYLQEK